MNGNRRGFRLRVLQGQDALGLPRKMWGTCNYFEIPLWMGRLLSSFVRVYLPIYQQKVLDLSSNGPGPQSVELD